MYMKDTFTSIAGLAESTQKYRKLFDSMNEGYSICGIVLDGDGNAVDFRFLEINKAYEEHTGLKADDIVGRTILEIAPDIEDSWIEVLRKSVETHTPIRHRGYNISTKRHYDALVFSLQEGKLILILNDITQQMQMEAALRESEERLRSLVNSMPDEVWFADTNKMVTLVNPAAPREFEKPFYQESIEHLTLGFEVLRPDGSRRPIEESPLFRALNGETVENQEELVRTPESNEMGYRQVSASPAKNVNGEIIGSVAVVRDITERKNAEEKLRKSEERLRTVHENSLDRFTILAPLYDQQGEIINFAYVYQNAQAAKTAGRSPEEIIGLRVTEVWPAFPKTRFFTMYKQAAKTGQATEFEELYHADGMYDWFRATVTPVPDGIAIATQIITEHKRAEEALAFQAKLLYSVHDAIIAANENFIITYWNEIAEQLFGWKAEEAIGKPSAEIFRVIVPGSSRSEAISKMMNNDYYEGEAICHHKNGREIYTHVHAQVLRDDNGTFKGNVSSFRDITERKQAEEALHKSKKRHEFLLRISDAMRPLSDPVEVHTAVTRMAMDYFNSDRCYYGEIKNDAVIIRQDSSRGDLPPVAGVYPLSTLPIHKSLLETGQPFSITDVNTTDMTDEELRRLCIQLKVISYLDVPVIKDGKLSGVLCVVQSSPRNWTEAEAELAVEIAERTWAAVERAKAAEALRESEQKALALVAELEEADKNKNQFISVLSHELRNPLATIVAGLSLIETAENTEQIAKVKEILRRQTNQLCKLVDDLLELTRITHNNIELKRENINLNEIITNAVSDMKSAFEKKRFILDVSLPTQPIFLYADPVRISQCVSNYLNNALKFTPDNGTVRISLREDSGYAVIRVQDNGLGIDHRFLVQLFKPFTQADHSLNRSNNGGLGLGLSIVKGIIELHGGTVEASSPGLGKGATFTMKLPI